MNWKARFYTTYYKKLLKKQKRKHSVRRAQPSNDSRNNVSITSQTSQTNTVLTVNAESQTDPDFINIELVISSVLSYYFQFICCHFAKPWHLLYDIHG